FGWRDLLQGCLESRDITLDPLGSAPGDRTVAGRKLEPSWRKRHVRVELWKHTPLHLGRHRPRLAVEAGQTLGDVRRKTDTAHLAVAGDVDARLALPLDHRADGRVDQLGCARASVHLALIASLHQVQNLPRTGQAARMRGEDARGAALHPRAQPPGWQAPTAARHA